MSLTEHTKDMKAGSASMVPEAARAAAVPGTAALMNPRVDPRGLNPSAKNPTAGKGRGQDPIRRQVQPRWRVRAALTSVLGVCMMVAACAAVKTTEQGHIGLNRTQRMSPLVSEADLNRSAEAAYAEVLSKSQSASALNVDAAMTKRVRGIASRLIPAVEAFRPDALKWKWEVNVIQSDELNAWCMPGGKIAFYSGIINRLKLSDDEIAAIMGHEIAHALREHARERASEQATAGLLIGIGAAAAGVGQAGQDLGQLAYQTTFGLRHSRLHETEADRIGVELSARAGYDPRAAITLWQKMAQASGGGGTPEFLSTHPSAKTRIKDLQDYSQRVLPLYKPGGVK
ncbi:MAG: M48 family metallopeptidase [Lautropia sp.]|nr:M48 family metallopeptidase [Lautropia sp.]